MQVKWPGIGPFFDATFLLLACFLPGSSPEKGLACTSFYCSARGPMISKVIYFVDDWVKANIGAHTSSRDAEWLAQRCIADAAKAGFTNEQLEEDLGTDLL